MRALMTLACAAWMAFDAGAQVRPTTTQAQEIQQRVNETAERKAEELAALIKGSTAGALSMEANVALSRWSEAVRRWKRERNAGAAPLLAEGVLFDCLSRLEGVTTVPVIDERPTPFFGDLAAARPGKAARAFEAALRIDGSLLEASFRLARIKSVRDRSAAIDLERLANAGDAPAIAYLAALSRAEWAGAQDDFHGAVQWYERARAIHPASTAAAVAWAALTSGPTVPFERLDRDDLYYSYPCAVLTREVGTALAERVRALTAK